MTVLDVFPGHVAEYEDVKADVFNHLYRFFAGYYDEGDFIPRRHYGNPETGGYFLTADDAEGLVVRPNSTLDDAIPNPNAIAEVHDGIAAHLHARGFSSLAELPRYLPRD